LILEAKNVEEIIKILKTFSYAVIITKAEDKVLTEKGLKKNIPDTYSHHHLIEQVFSRYLFAKIGINKVEFDKKKIINCTDFLQVQNGSCEVCGLPFGQFETVQSTNLICEQCGGIKVICRNCRPKAKCSCKGLYLDAWDKMPGLLF
jgi:hypothetical protein